jgi:hypothetical protein
MASCKSGRLCTRYKARVDTKLGAPSHSSNVHCTPTACHVTGTGEQQAGSGAKPPLKHRLKASKHRNRVGEDVNSMTNFTSLHDAHGSPLGNSPST